MNEEVLKPEDEREMFEMVHDPVGTWKRIKKLEGFVEAWDRAFDAASDRNEVLARVPSQTMPDSERRMVIKFTRDEWESILHARLNLPEMAHEREMERDGVGGKGDV